MACILATFLAGCDATEHNARRVGQDIHQGYDASREKLSRLIYEEQPTPQAYVPPAPPSFCYRTLMDIVCYDAPRPELHLTLVSVQGAHSYRYEDFLPKPVLESYGLERSDSGAGGQQVAISTGGALSVSELPSVAADGASATTGTPFYASPSPSVVDHSKSSGGAMVDTPVGATDQPPGNPVSLMRAMH